MAPMPVVAAAVGPANLFSDGGAVMYLVLALGLAQMAGVVAQLATARRLDFMPLLWSTLAAQVSLGALTTLSHVVVTLGTLSTATDAAVHATLTANIAAVVLFGGAGTLAFALLGCLGNGIAHVVVHTLNPAR